MIQRQNIYECVHTEIITNIRAQLSKLLNNKGEFINAAEGETILQLAAAEKFEFVTVEKLGKIVTNETTLTDHIEKILLHKAC